MYTMSDVITILLHGSEDHDEVIDVAAALVRMPEPARSVLELFAQGFSVQQSMTLCGVNGNSTRYQDQIIEQLTSLVNGGSGVHAKNRPN